MDARVEKISSLQTEGLTSYFEETLEVLYVNRNQIPEMRKKDIFSYFVRAILQRSNARSKDKLERINSIYVAIRIFKLENLKKV